MLRSSKYFSFLVAIVAVVGLSGVGMEASFAAETLGSSEKPVTLINPFSFILLELGLVVIVALIAQVASKRFRFPIVIGELLFGIIVGNLLYWFEWSPLFYLIMHLGDASALFKIVWSSDLSVVDAATRLFDSERSDPGPEFLKLLTEDNMPEFAVMVIALWIFSNFGVFVLLFKLGLETRLEDLRAAEPIAFAISAAGAAIPFLLGLLVSFWLISDVSAAVHIFVAATLCTTSAAITSELFSGVKGYQRERRLALDAAYIDDVIGIFFLAILMGIALNDKGSLQNVVGLIMPTVLFLTMVILFGRHCIRFLWNIYPSDKAHTNLIIPVSLIFILSWLAEILELGVVAGAFTAGLILSHKEDKKLNAEALLAPMETIFVPVFFVFVGMQVNLKSFLDPHILFLAFALTVVAVAGKMATAFVVRGSLNHLVIGLGLVSRGEAVLIFVSVGKVLGVVSDSIFSVIVMMVILTNFIAPWGLKRIADASEVE